MRNGPATVHLDSQADFSSALDGLLASTHSNATDAEVVAPAAAAGGWDAAKAKSLCEARRDEVAAALLAIKRHLGVKLLGVDMVAAADGTLLVVDANHFSGAPGSVPGFGAALAQSAMRHCKEHFHRD